MAEVVAEQQLVGIFVLPVARLISVVAATAVPAVAFAAVVDEVAATVSAVEQAVPASEA